MKILIVHNSYGRNSGEEAVVDRMSAMFRSQGHEVALLRRTTEEARNTIGDKVWIGCRTTILKGSVIPDGCVIGAGSLVTGKIFSPNTIIIGSPAKSVRTIDGWEL